MPDPVTIAKGIKLVVALIQGAERAMALARTLSQAKAQAEEQGRPMSPQELESFKQQAHTAVAELDQAIDEAS